MRNVKKIGGKTTKEMAPSITSISMSLFCMSRGSLLNKQETSALLSARIDYWKNLTDREICLKLTLILEHIVFGDITSILHLPENELLAWRRFILLNLWNFKVTQVVWLFSNYNSFKASPLSRVSKKWPVISNNNSTAS